MTSPDPSKNKTRTDLPSSDSPGSTIGPPGFVPEGEPTTIEPIPDTIPAADPDATLAFRPSGSAIGRALTSNAGAAVLDIDDCARDLTEGGLMDAAEVASFRERIASRDGPQDAEALVRELMRAGRLTAYQAGAVLQGKSKGLVIGNYDVLDKLGAGGMGVVFKAQHRRLKRVVALKLLPPSLARDPSAVYRFQREAKAAAKLSHPNVVAVLDADEFRGLFFLVMEYVEGRDLGRLVREQGPLPVARAIDCIIQAARGLKAAYEANVVHRDIKPSNLMLDPGGTLKILDMGLARFDEAAGLLGADKPDVDVTQSNVLVGTVDYMSPEQAYNPKNADHRSDIYSLGCTLHFLLTGRPPFGGETTIERLIAHRERPIPTLTDARPDVPAVFNDILRRMLAKLPKDRISSLDELIADLEACRSGISDNPLAPMPRPVPPPEEEEPAGVSRIRRIALIAGLAATALIVMATGIYLSRPGSHRDDRKDTRIAVAPAPAIAPPEAHVPPAPLSAPVSRNEVVEVVKEAVESKPRLPILDEPVGVVREFKGHQRRVNSVAVSEDGLRAMSGGQDRTIRLWDVATGQEGHRVEHDGPVNAVAMTLNGRLGLSGSDDKTVRRWDLRTDHDVGMRRLEGHTGPVFAVAVALEGKFALSGSADRTVRVWDIADGREVGPPMMHDSPVIALATSSGDVAMTGCEDGTVWLWDLKSRQMVRRLRGPGPVLCVAISPAGNRALSGHPDGVLVAWDLDHGTEVGRMIGHGDFIRCVAYLPDGRRALAGSQTGFLILWDVESQRALYQFPRPSGGTPRAGQLGLAVLSDGLHALSADTDATVRLWRLPAIDADENPPAPR